MSDFAQSGAICTLQRLNETHLGPLAGEWMPQASPDCPVTLILPCHAPDLGTPALIGICRELSQSPWVSEVLIPINGLDVGRVPSIRGFFREKLQLPHTLLLTDSGKLPSILSEAVGRPAEALAAGKGLNVWAAMGFAFASKRLGLLALQDCDVLSFQRATLARLCFSVADPDLRFGFAKMYYSRVTDRLYGRVSRLFLTPLLHALLRVAGHHPLLHFLLSFRYPLAGECSLESNLAGRLPIHSGWALEIGMLCDVFRTVDSHQICQVDGGTGYDHKHQPAARHLTRMCEEIAVCLLHELSREGCEISDSFLLSLGRAMEREAREATRRSAALARINGLTVSVAEEVTIAEAFARCLPVHLPEAQTPLPPWSTVDAGVLEKLRQHRA